MKIALLNLPFDANYGGNLQRYALIKVLQQLGHEVYHVNLKSSYTLPLYKRPFCYAKRLILKSVGLYGYPILYEKYIFETLQRNARDFYLKYIPHTDCIKSIRELDKLKKYNFGAFVVGSDQVWRKEYTSFLGIQNYFFKFLGDSNVKRIGYAISMGTDTHTMSQKEIKECTKLYERFSAVSFREESGIQLALNNGWNSPSPIRTLDPTMLLPVEHYKNLTTASNTEKCAGNLFCYILDPSKTTQEIVKNKSKELGLVPFSISFKETKTSVPSIEQWIRAFMDAEYVITDSFHGTVFSILFNKPFYILENSKRGNARLESLLSTLKINKEIINWGEINSILDKEKEISITYLKKSLENYLT